MDSIIIELSFPAAPYSKRILYQILHEAVDESPREARRFPQELWNAVGDLSVRSSTLVPRVRARVLCWRCWAPSLILLPLYWQVTLEIQELLERPLLGPVAASWKNQPRDMPEEYEKWIDAQIISEKASKNITNYKDIIFPLEVRTKQKHVLESMWKCVNLVSVEQPRCRLMADDNI